MNEYIYKVTELAVNGTEENVEEYIISALPLNNQAKVFQNILKEVKATYINEGWDTCNFVEEACKLFNGRFFGYYLKPYNPNIMIMDTITF